MTKNNEWIICFGSKLSSPSIYTEKQLIKRFQRDGYKILWVNPLPQKNISVKDFSKKKSLLNKIFLRIKTQIKIFSKVEDGFYQITPLFYPNVEKNIENNTNLIKKQVALFSKLLRIKSFSIISSGLTDIPKIFPKRNFNFFIQVSGDLYSDLRNLSDDLRNNILTKERSVFNYADKILAASTNIYEKVKLTVSDNNKVIYFPHGVEFEHFNKIAKSNLENYKKPIAGYFGSLTENNDQRMFIALAEAGFTVILIGKIIGDYSSCTHKNIHFLGAVDYKDLPSYSQNFDICIMAWKPAEWINNCNPSKTLEYFAMGKPIISNTIPELKNKYSDLIYFADEPNEFVKQANSALKEDNGTLSAKRIEIAKNEAWDIKYSTVRNFLEK